MEARRSRRRLRHPGREERDTRPRDREWHSKWVRAEGGQRQRERLTI